jgi:hypothetical protein
MLVAETKHSYTCLYLLACVFCTAVDEGHRSRSRSRSHSRSRSRSRSRRRHRRSSRSKSRSRSRSHDQRRRTHSHSRSRSRDRVEDDRPAKRSRSIQGHGEDRPGDSHAARHDSVRDGRHEEGHRAPGRSVHDRLGGRVPEEEHVEAGDAAAAAAGGAHGGAGGRVQRTSSRSERPAGKFGVWGGILQRTLQETSSQPSSKRSRWDRK